VNSQQYLESSFSKWMEGTGPENEVVISSRIRLARNLEGFSFPHFMSEEEAAKVIEAVKKAAEQQAMINKLGSMQYIDFNDLASNERQMLVEKHLVSPQHIETPVNRGVLVTSDESVCIMVNEEDHLRLQCMLPGLQLEETWVLADKIDDILENSLDYSFCEKRGYLTSCPTNVGTGLRASVMLHLPCLVMTKQIGKIVNTISQLGLAVRGYYGEGTEAHGNLFQVSNQVTLGQTEDEIIKNLMAVTKQLVAQEKSTRENILKDSKVLLEDRIYRAFGAMRYARMMAPKEALNNISDIRLGVEMGILKGLNYSRINELIIQITPAFLIKRAGKQLDSGEMNSLRAEIVRDRLLDIKID
jgi:protein arginine kinase